MIDRRRWPSVQRRSAEVQIPAPSGPRCAMRSRIVETTDASLASPCGRNAPTMPHISGAYRLDGAAKAIARREGAADAQLVQVQPLEPLELQARHLERACDVGFVGLPPVSPQLVSRIERIERHEREETPRRFQHAS